MDIQGNEESVGIGLSFIAVGLLGVYKLKTTNVEMTHNKQSQQK